MLSTISSILVFGIKYSKKASACDVSSAGKIPSNLYEYTALTKDGRELELEVSLSHLSFKGKEKRS